MTAKFERLENKVLQQEIEINSLKEQVQRLESVLTDSNKNSRSLVIPYADVSAVFMPRTCAEARDSGLPEFQASGMYWIDPDGIGIGDGAIYVHCNMTAGEDNLIFFA